MHSRAIMMVRPARFGFNPQTAASNSFQHSTDSDVHQAACDEFDNAVKILRGFGVTVDVFQDDRSTPLPDSVFPNNWFSTTCDSELYLYPMLAPNRREERRITIINELKKRYGYRFVFDFSPNENEGKFLEGTGSMVFDHDQHIAFAAISSRTDKDVLLEVCEKQGYLPFVFECADRNGNAIYHTNVITGIGHEIAVFCFDAVSDPDDRIGIRNYFKRCRKTVVEISMQQMEQFAGNVLFIEQAHLAGVLGVISETAWNSLDSSQKSTFESFAKPVIIPVPVIEKHGGGSIRCMLAELY
jgi:hypothetical protein